jgi:hypothetical protein
VNDPAEIASASLHAVRPNASFFLVEIEVGLRDTQLHLELLDSSFDPDGVCFEQGQKLPRILGVSGPDRRILRGASKPGHSFAPRRMETEPLVERARGCEEKCRPGAPVPGVLRAGFDNLAREPASAPEMVSRDETDPGDRNSPVPRPECEGKPGSMSNEASIGLGHHATAPIRRSHESRKFVEDSGRTVKLSVEKSAYRRVFSIPPNFDLHGLPPRCVKFGAKLPFLERTDR